MGNNLARQLIADHFVEGEMRPGEEIALKMVAVRDSGIPAYLLGHFGCACRRSGER